MSKPVSDETSYVSNETNYQIVRTGLASLGWMMYDKSLLSLRASRRQGEATYYL